LQEAQVDALLIEMVHRLCAIARVDDLVAALADHPLQGAEV
jgi:hypothetical protein